MNRNDKRKFIVYMLIVIGFITGCKKENINEPTPPTNKNNDTTVTITPNYKKDNPSVKSLDSLQKTGKHVQMKLTQTDYYGPDNYEITYTDIAVLINKYLDSLAQKNIYGNPKDTFYLLEQTANQLPFTTREWLRNNNYNYKSR